MSGSVEVISTARRDRIVTPGTSASLPRNSFGTCTQHRPRRTMLDDDHVELAVVDARVGAMSAPLPYCRALAIATSSARDRAAIAVGDDRVVVRPRR